MYSLFLFLSLLSFLLLLRALDRRTWGSWAGWGAVLLLGVAAHPYGALVFAAQGVFVALARRDQLRRAAVAFVVVGLAGTPFWITDLVLANRFDVGVGGRGGKLGGPWAIVTYLWQTAGDFSSGRWPVLVVVLMLGLVGLIVVRNETRALVLCVIGVPVAAFLAARLGGSTSPESRHLIFVLPFFAIVVGVGIVRTTRRLPAATIALTAVLVVLEVGWAWNRTPQLFEWEPNKRQATRAQAEEYLATTSRRNDILFGYEPLYLGAWERNSDFPDVVVPRADSVLALRTIRRQARPLGRGIWILDASERNNLKPRLEIENRDPGPAGTFETRAFGPFLVIRTTNPWATTAPTSRPQLARCSSGGRSVSVTPTSTCRRSSAPIAFFAATGRRCACSPTPRDSRARSRTRRAPTARRPAVDGEGADGRPRRQTRRGCHRSRANASSVVATFDRRPSTHPAFRHPHRDADSVAPCEDRR